MERVAQRLIHLGTLANIDTDGPGMPADQFFHDTPQSEHVVPNVTAGGFAGEMMVQELMSYQMIRLQKPGMVGLDAGFDTFLSIIGDMLSKENKVPANTYYAKKLIVDGT